MNMGLGGNSGSMNGGSMNGGSVNGGSMNGGSVLDGSKWVIRDVSVSLDDLEPESEQGLLRRLAAARLGVPPDSIRSLAILRESLDARKKNDLAAVYSLVVETAAKPSKISESYSWNPPVHASIPQLQKNGFHGLRPIVVGAGPCGLFCALTLAEAGLAPILIERGQPVDKRRQDVAAFWRAGVLDTESNVQFGEGGAGTFSDGKLMTRIHDPRCARVLETLAACGAPEDILYRAKPHIGTDGLVQAITALRGRLLELGTEIRFGARMEGLILRKGRVCGVKLQDGSELDSSATILAIGHSARDTFAMLHACGISMEPKPFSVGVRIEHHQAEIDRVQYGGRRHYKLGPSEYQLFERFSDRTAYTFCMCPGGQVVAAASEAGTVVTNGMSSRARSGDNANSAFVVSVGPSDVGTHPLDGVAFQRNLEQSAFRLGGGTYAAPIQRLSDFLERRQAPVLRMTKDTGSIRSSYTGEVRHSRLDAALPPFVYECMRNAVPVFERKMRGFAAPDALLTGFETRTSSPLRLPRGVDFASVGAPGLYPAGEGAGHAGGIMSAAVDGVRVAEAVLAVFAKGGC